MLDPERLREFKESSKEDEIVGDLILSHVPQLFSSILDIGSGRGIIPRKLVERSSRPLSVTVIEPNIAFTFPNNYRVVRDAWEAYQGSDQFDIVLMVHVVGHFADKGRVAAVAKAINHLSLNGVLVIVENAPLPPFWDFNRIVSRHQKSQYLIDFVKLEKSLKKMGCRFKKFDHVTTLYLGSSRWQQIRNLNVIFPEEFSAKDLRTIDRYWLRLFPKSDGYLRIAQRFYFVNHTITM